VRKVRLGDVADINPRVAAELKALPDQEIAFLPMDAVGEDGLVRYQERRSAASVLTGYTLFKRGDVLFAKITPCMENGKAAFLDDLATEYGAGSTEFHVIRPGSDLDGGFLFYLIWNPAFRFKAEARMTGSAGQRVPADFLKDLEFYCPPLDEQRRIAAILDKADAIRRKRQQALALADDVLRSAFLEMFGDIRAKKTKFSLQSIRGLVKASSGKSSKPVISDAPTDFPIYGGNGINGWASRPLYNEPVIVVGRVGQQCGITRLTDRPAWVTDNAIAIRVAHADRLDADYLEYALQMSPLRSKVQHLDLPFINQAIILDFPLPLPPIEVQHHFAHAKKALMVTTDHARSALHEAETLFASLSQRAFRGDLSPASVPA
jgi:type I restriction enzyme S subunit